MKSIGSIREEATLCPQVCILGAQEALSRMDPIDAMMNSRIRPGFRFVKIWCSSYTAPDGWVCCFFSWRALPAAPCARGLWPLFVVVGSLF